MIAIIEDGVPQQKRGKDRFYIALSVYYCELVSIQSNRSNCIV